MTYILGTIEAGIGLAEKNPDCRLCSNPQRPGACPKHAAENVLRLLREDGFVKCTVTGTAAVARVHGQPVWQRMDPAIHVAAELLDDLEAKDEIERKYRIGDWCETEQAYHAYLHREPQ